MIPDYQTLMLPLLEILSDGEECSSRQLVDRLGSRFELSGDERLELLPSGKQPIFDNRVGWAKTYLKKAGLIHSPRRAVFAITESGGSVLNDRPGRIDNRFLSQFESFNDFRHSKTPTGSIVSISTMEASQSVEQTPDEILQVAYQKLRAALASQLLNRIAEQPPDFFERLVVQLLVRMGYGGSFKNAGMAVGRAGDGGIDGTIKQDKLGLDIIYIQAKRWQPGNPVGRPELHKFVGALAEHGAKKGVFITTSSFTSDALNYVPRNDTKVVLIDGEELAQLMMDYNLGCTIQEVYEVKKIDSDYFDEE